MKKALSLVLVLIMALSFAACGGAYETETTSEISTQPETLVVPKVVGMDKDEAVKLLEGMGFEVEVRALHMSLYLNAETMPKVGDIVSQNLSQGIVCAPKSKITICYASDETEFEYKNNEDGTITLTYIKAYYSENSTITIPRIYNGKTVSCIEFNENDFFFPDNKDWVIRIPEGVKNESKIANPVEVY